MARKRKKLADKKPLLNNSIYATKGAGMKKPKKRSQGIALARDNRAAGSAIKKGQKEAKIQALMKEKSITYAQAVIELM
jgi:hypothetical protein